MKRLNVKKIIRNFLVALICVIVGIVGGITVLMNTDSEIFAEKTNKTSEVALVKESLKELSEWTTLKYEYENVIVSRTSKTLPLPGNHDINYAEAIKLIEYSGYLKAGTNLKEIQLILDEETKQASVKLPKSQILDNVAETKKMKVEDIKGNILSDYPPQTIIDEINSNKKQLEEEKINQGFLEEADKKIKIMVTDFLASHGYVVSVEFY
ncbi:DUF4230 domain-containing protein [Jeotgalibaca sp. MA1X17-3]|uniref:DUF4230 domain-containing protein n=1 Tax=Jeotgalibaca sp. MA1X17-3 TaxID=2908211 RepID=UPI001F31A844|nr:DUF4230 domain-containing protein [Jeotgalibaca sp. MA1X17-3]UJF15965.1 DUF4230 domain-containing protein [Jeotgalibaca sp. MA1X17-3]